MKISGRICVLALACAMAAASLRAAPGGAGGFGAALAVLMLAIARVDARHFFIPDELTIAAFVLALANAAIQGQGGIAESLVVAAIRALVVAAAFLLLRSAYYRLRGRQGLGLGDVKLAGVAGAWLDWEFISIAIEIAALAAIAAYLARQLVLRRPLEATARLPFGLYLAPSIWVAWFIQALLGGT